MSRKYKFNQQPEASKERGSVREVYGDKSIQKISHAFAFENIRSDKITTYISILHLIV